MVTDPIADLFTRLRNGYMAGKKQVSAPHSSLKGRILTLLKKNKYITDFSIEEDGVKKNIIISLNDVKKAPRIPHFKRISKPGCRLYLKSTEIKKSHNGHGIYIMSTPKGVITGYEARSLKVGGEILGEVY